MFAAVCLLVGCLKSQQHASVSQGRICTDNFTCCHTEKLQIQLSTSPSHSILTPFAVACVACESTITTLKHLHFFCITVYASDLYLGYINEGVHTVLQRSIVDSKAKAHSCHYNHKSSGVLVLFGTRLSAFLMHYS